ncbi:TraR/DksA family transcriptional regulator [Amorphus coralli]|uniref:TraR/DksA family transcriptional regulator n=1 Tax=Amorphus coralli TaxID=340680 RepID=UPI00037116A5|nr:TraR/DksA C4-type zinc finger protein [Amorphus coralli]
MLDEKSVRVALEAERGRIRAEIEDSAESRATVELDQTSVGRLSRMDALQGQAMARAADERRRLRLSRIAATLTRLDDGEFGACVSCGEDIAEARLMLDLTTPTCIRCAR